MEKITAIIQGSSNDKGLNISHRKEDHFLYELVGIVVTDQPDGSSAIKEAVNLRIYGTNAKNYCCMWANNRAVWLAGSGSAGGYGYHRPSAAAEEAIKKAGVKLSQPIDARGDEAMKEAVEAIARALYPEARLVYVVHAHP